MLMQLYNIIKLFTICLVTSPPNPRFSSLREKIPTNPLTSPGQIRTYREPTTRQRSQRFWPPTFSWERKIWGWLRDEFGAFSLFPDSVYRTVAQGESACLTHHKRDLTP